MSTLTHFPVRNTPLRARLRHIWQWAKAGRSIPALATFLGGVLVLPVLAFGVAYPLLSGSADTLFHSSAQDIAAWGGPDIGGPWGGHVTVAALAVSGALIVLYSVLRVVRRGAR
ncbi:hypothetical protein ACFZBU_21665 [Embleya sp. NPDC008237]|uniref:hypothetical protein n=1 Tax=Embleya sp. NPDC008237 TaxID=3363978 RepID=UPI0036E37F78